MLTEKVVEFRRGGNPRPYRQPRRSELLLPDVPVLSETLLLVELAASDPPVELARVSRLILSDPGATIQVLRVAGRECAEGCDSGRIENCIAALGIDACLDAMSKWTIIRNSRYAGVVDAWEHARDIAEASSQLAKEWAWDAPLEEAALVGLCHEIGNLPERLGWGWVFPGASDVDFAGLTIAEAWLLPSCVREYFASRLDPGIHSHWPAIVNQAHEITAFRRRDDSLLLHLEPAVLEPAVMV